MIKEPKIEFRGFDFRDRTGVWRTIYPCSVLNREYLKGRIDQIWKFVQNYPDDNANFEQLLADDQFEFLCSEALRLGGVDRDWLSIEYYEAMVLPYINGEGEQEMKPILVALNFPEIEKQQQVKLNEEGDPETFFDLLAALWYAGQSLQEAIEVSALLPMEELSKILESRAKIVEQAGLTDKDKSKQSAKDKLIQDQDQVYSKLPEDHPMRTKWEKFKKKRKR